MTKTPDVTRPRKRTLATAGAEGTPLVPAVAEKEVAALIPGLKLVELKDRGAGTFEVKWCRDLVTRRPQPVYAETLRGIRSSEALAEAIRKSFDQAYPEYEGQNINTRAWEAAIDGLGYAASASGSKLLVTQDGKQRRKIEVGFPIDSMVSLPNLARVLQNRRGFGSIVNDNRLAACAVVAGRTRSASGEVTCRISAFNLETGERLDDASFHASFYPMGFQAQKIIPPPPAPEKPAGEPVNTAVVPKDPTAPTLAERRRYEAECRAYDQAEGAFREATQAYRGTPAYKAWKRHQVDQQICETRARSTTDDSVAPVQLPLVPGRIELFINDPATNLDGHLRPFKRDDKALLQMAFGYRITPDAEALKATAADAAHLFDGNVQLEVVGTGGARTVLGKRTPSPEMLTGGSGKLLSCEVPIIPIDFPYQPG